MMRRRKPCIGNPNFSEHFLNKKIPSKLEVAPLRSKMSDWVSGWMDGWMEWIPLGLL